MYLARFLATGPDGAEPRILASADPATGWVDVRGALQRRLQAAGATRDAALRIAAASVPGSLSAALAGGDVFLDAARMAADDSGDHPRINPDRLACPVDPPSYRDYMTFAGHFSFGYRWRDLPVPPVMYELPVAYLGNPQSFLGPGDEVPWPHFSSELDYELELGIVIGRGGRDIEPANARSHILGLTILNDLSARDIQRQEMAAGLGPCKGKHFGSSVGPWIATLDEIDVGNLAMAARVNGDTRCQANSGEMIWSIEELVAWTSAAEPLVAGTLLGSGTANGGSGVEFGTLLAPGDVVELEVQGLGTLRNTMGAKGHGWMPAPRSAVA